MDPVFVDRVVAFRFQFPDLLFDQVTPELFVVDYRTVTVGVVPEVTGSRVSEKGFQKKINPAQSLKSNLL